MNIVLRCGAALVLLTAVVVSPVNVYSCGPYFAKAVFVLHSGPDFPVASFLQGNLGIVQPEYSSLYLFAAYRHLNRKPLSADEQRLVSEALEGNYGRQMPSAAYDEWVAARQAVVGPAPAPDLPFDAMLSDESRNLYSFYQNISDDAFHTAAVTLKQRTAAFGAQSPVVIDWVRAQDAVFMSEQSGISPPPANPESPALALADRAYQIAAAQFYMRHFSRAESLFTAIAGDNASPWNKLSRYLVARTKIREATLIAENQDSALAGAEEYLQAFLKDSSVAGLHETAARLMNFCMFRTNPKEHFRELDGKIMGKMLGPGFPTEWRDYAELFRLYEDSAFAGQSDFPDWVASYRGNFEPKKSAHAYQRWRTTHSAAWLIAALSDADPASAEAATLLRAAARVSPHAPEYATVSYWRIRLLVSRKENQEAEKLIAALLADTSLPKSASTTNLLLAERTTLARDFDEFLRSCCQQASGIMPEDLSPEPWPNAPVLFSPGASALNRFVPLNMLRDAAMGSALPASLRQSLMRAVWTRSVLLGYHEVARALTDTLSALDPELKPFLEEYASAAGADARRFAAAWGLLKFPGLHPSIRIGVERSTPLHEIDNYRDNWWYTRDLAIEASAGEIYARGFTAEGDRHTPPVQPPLFLTKAEREEAGKERELLSSLPAAATLLGRIVIAWATAHPGDPRVPEALHLVVQVSRVGCTDAMTGPVSKKAHAILHFRYPHSEWTAKTRYWYK